MPEYYRYIVRGSGPYFVYDRKTGQDLRRYEVQANAVAHARALNRL